MKYFKTIFYFLRKIKTHFHKKQKKGDATVVDTIDKKYLTHILPEDAHILEAGTANGIDTSEFAELFPKGIIYGFECVPDLFNQASTRTAKYKNVILSQYALGESSSRQKLFLSTLADGETFGSSSLLTPKEHIKLHQHVKFENEIWVDTTTVDDWVQKNKIKRIDFMWLDLQGLEMAVLKNAKSILGNVKAIFTEVSLLETYENVPQYQELKDFLEYEGFTVELEFLPYKDMGNVLFVRNGILK